MSDRKEHIRVVHTAPSRGQLDLVAVERAVNGSAPEGMTGLELHEAARILIRAGLASAPKISAQLGVPTATLRRWFPIELARPVVDTSPVRCGTVRGYRRHLSAGEPTCQDCRSANNAHDYELRRARYGAVA